MKIWHATSRQHLDSIRQHGLLVACADPNAKIQGVWACTASNRGWAILHTIRKHKVQLEDVVVIEITIPRSRLTRFKKGFYWTTQDVPPTALGQIIDGAAFGASLSE